MNQISDSTDVYNYFIINFNHQIIKKLKMCEKIMFFPFNRSFIFWCLLILIILSSCIDNLNANKISSTSISVGLVHPNYLKNHETEFYLHELESKYPNLARVSSIGLSQENRNLNVIRISRSVDQKRDLLKPMFKYVANIHGNEPLGRQLVIELADYLLKNYGKVNIWKIN
jgi:carboxypeptidase D